MTATFWIVRHGQTDWNVEGRFQGQADPPLNATGLAQAEALAGRLADRAFAALYTSDLRRARQTAAALGRRLGLTPRLDPRLREVHHGAWDGLLLAEIHERFVVVDGEPDLSAVVRPRTTPLLTEFATAAGPQRVWTTFGPDQADLDYADPGTLLAIVEVRLDYVHRGASLVRLDAVAFLWKQAGSTCLHLAQTHAVVRLLRAVLDGVAPDTHLVTETNVPHADALRYLGGGEGEAQLAYNFALPPLVLHTFRTGDATALAGWADGLAAPSGAATFLNFLASHDGVGLNPVRDLLGPEDVEALVAHTSARGGRVSRRSGPDGEPLPYELNVNYLDALAEPSGAPHLRRFLCAHAIALAVVGVPMLYLHSLVGSRGWPAGVEATGRARAINRERLGLDALERELADPGSRRARVLAGLARLAAARGRSAAFDPYGAQAVEDCGSGCFALCRRPRGAGPSALCLHNVTAAPLAIRLEGGSGARPLVADGGATGLYGDEAAVTPYGYLWLERDD